MSGPLLGSGTVLGGHPSPLRLADPRDLTLPLFRGVRRPQLFEGALYRPKPLTGQGKIGPMKPGARKSKEMRGMGEAKAAAAEAILARAAKRLIPLMALMYVAS